MTSTKHHSLWIFLGLLSISCGESAPDSPTYFGDVRSILNANCGRCHGADPYEEKLASFRLDRFVRNDSAVNPIADVADNLELIVVKSVMLEEPAMPPDYTLSDRQQKTLVRWVENGAPKGTRENTKPSAQLLAPAETTASVDQSLDVTMRSWDDDGDGLLVSIGVRESGSLAGTIILSGLGGGERSFEVDTGQLRSKQRFELYAIVDDGFSDEPEENAHEIILHDDIFVDHGERGTAPTVLLLHPNDGGTFYDTVTIQWSAMDPDLGDELAIDLDLLSEGELIQSIQQGLPNSPQTFSWDPTGLPSIANGLPIEYSIRVTATDIGAKNTRSDVSDLPFTLTDPVADTDLTWADVKPTFVTYCRKCHSEPARTGALDYFRLDKYDAQDPEHPGDSDLGVYELRNLVLERLVVQSNMPPNAEPSPPASEVLAIEEWILAGAPFASGPSNGKPIFLWSTPNDGAISPTDSNGNITLNWSATDPEGLPFASSSIEYLQIMANADQNATCGDTLMGWIEEPGVDIDSGTHAWTAPAEGYFCFRGSITDEAGQSVQPVATRPVKFSSGPGPPGP